MTVLRRTIAGIALLGAALLAIAIARAQGAVLDTSPGPSVQVATTD
jgi:hypothetical protein